MLDMKTDVEFADLLGLSKTTISTWRSRNKIPYEELLVLHVHSEIDLLYCLTGQPSGVAAGAVAERILEDTIERVRKAFGLDEASGASPAQRAKGPQ